MWLYINNASGFLYSLQTPKGNMFITSCGPFPNFSFFNGGQKRYVHFVFTVHMFFRLSHLRRPQVRHPQIKAIEINNNFEAFENSCRNEFSPVNLTSVNHMYTNPPRTTCTPTLREPHLRRTSVRVGALMSWWLVDGESARFVSPQGE